MHKELDIQKIIEIYEELKLQAPTDHPKFAFKKVETTKDDKTTTELQILANPSGYIHYGLELLKAVIETPDSKTYAFTQNKIDHSHSDFVPKDVKLDDSIIPEVVNQDKKSGIFGCIVVIIIIAIIVIGIKG